ncbi:hypothetical protein SNOG_12531 [Parastagonospora nodorum SN15]|uniref:Uncharacterized protein n=1 Tax=Phaeosphaeria nodorum (strain SN15 / ATCC MYA-4574 / FGSC 10173) TaxID=321614 RepID=Q0U6T3_PHANO|nr:hypothetical protein SNOG_12531 [Parastagonospora nodorum SN15]EAT80344.1 hypothetical protein SNOG_12531 [Parastagonospora nodorum SN15]
MAIVMGLVMSNNKQCQFLHQVPPQGLDPSSGWTAGD